MAGARKVSPAPRPTTKGLIFRTATMVRGSRVDMTTIEPALSEVLLLLALTLPLSAGVIWWLGERLLGGKEVVNEASSD